MSHKLPDIEKKFADWYNDVVYKADLADQAPVRGCIIIKPYGCALWENIRDVLDRKIKNTGHSNAIFPLLIPESFISREAEHIEGFSPELAIVTHAGGEKLAEPLVIRPTSETVIHDAFSRWITSWRDLPLKINQWANVMRWEMRPRAFMRTSEFFWQEGHTAHETAEDAKAEVATILDEYVDLIENYLAIPLVTGVKSEGEKFPGADKTITMEGMMRDGKALQMGTLHLLSQNFAKSFDITFQDRDEKQSYPYLTSWGVTTRLIGALIATHGDQIGIIMPPKVAPVQIVIVPILRGKSKDDAVLKSALDVYHSMKMDLRVTLDDGTQETPGAKFYKWELKGVPLRIEIGPRDVANGQVTVVDRLDKNKVAVPAEKVREHVETRLEEIQKEMFGRAKKRLEAMWSVAEKLEEFGPGLRDKGGAYQVGWCSDPNCEAALKEYKGTIRCLLSEKKAKECFNCSAKSNCDILVAKAY